MPKVSLLAIAVLLCSIPGCGQGKMPVPTIRVGHAPHDHHSPLYVAASDPGYFRQHGDLYLRQVVPREEYELVEGGTVTARVLISSGIGGKELVRRLSENHFDLSFGGVPAMLSFIDDGSPVKIISPVMAEGAGFVVPVASSLANFSDFLAHLQERGTPFRVGYKAGMSVQNLIFERALREEGITFSKNLADNESQVILVNVHGPKNLIPSMEGSVIDGFVVMQPYLALAEQQGVGKTIAYLDELPPEGKWQGNPCCALASTSSFIEEQGGVVESFLVLMMRANRYLAEHPETSARSVAAWLGLPREVEASSLPSIAFTTDLEGSWAAGVNFWIESMIDTGFIKGRVRESYLQGDHNDLLYEMKIYRRARGRI